MNRLFFAALAVVFGMSAAHAQVPTAIRGETNVKPLVCNGSVVTVTTGGTSQVAIPASPNLRGFSIMNADPTAGGGEPLWVSFVGTAAVDGANSFPLAPPAATTYAGAGSYTSPIGFGSNIAVSVTAGTTGHKYRCVKW